MIGRTIAEVEEMKPELLKQLAQQKKASFTDFLSGSVGPEDEILFNHLLRNLFKTLFAVIQGYNYIYTVLLNMPNDHISANENFQINDLWMLMQNEVKAFLYDHMSTSKHSEKPITVVESFGLNVKTSHVAKQLIQVAVHGDDKPLDDLYKALQNSNEAFQITKSDSNGVNNASGVNHSGGYRGESQMMGGLVGVMDRYSNQLATSHRVIIKPDTYLVILAFLPTQKFVQRVESLLDSKLSIIIILVSVWEIPLSF